MSPITLAIALSPGVVSFRHVSMRQPEEAPRGGPFCYRGAHPRVFIPFMADILAAGVEVRLCDVAVFVSILSSSLQEPALLRGAHMKAPFALMGSDLSCCQADAPESWSAAVILRNHHAGGPAVSGRTCTLLPSTRSTDGLRITWSPGLTPSRASTSVPRSRATDILRICARPFSTTATCNPSRLKMIASAGTERPGVL